MSLDANTFEETHRPKQLSGVIGNERHIRELNAQVAKVKVAIKEINKLMVKFVQVRESIAKTKEQKEKKRKILAKISSKINELKKNCRIRHQIFEGPAGVGKTTTAIAIGWEIYGNEVFNHLFLYNTADERRIEFMRTEIKNMTNRQPGNFPFNIIVMDESDAIRDDSQDTLKRIIEDSQFAIFILILNNINKIIDPLKSRCTVRKFKRIKKDPAIERLKEICNEEEIKYDEEFLSELYLSRSGDMRNCIGRLGELKDLGTKLTADHIESIKIDKDNIRSFLKLVFSGKIFQAFRLYQELCIEYSVSQYEFVEEALKDLLKTKWNPYFKSEVFVFAQTYVNNRESDLNVLAFIGKVYMSYNEYHLKKIEKVVDEITDEMIIDFINEEIGENKLTYDEIKDYLLAWKKFKKQRMNLHV